ncbi:MAG: zf-HC2 domain-containing protein [Methylococcaceae bacterium]
MQKKTNKNEHEIIVELLPWLVNDSLSDEESKRVDAHLQHCEKCRNEVNQLQAVNKHIAEKESEWQPTSAHFSSILSKIEVLEAVAPKQKKTKPKRWSDFIQYLLQTPTPVRWTLALALESIAIIALLTAWNISPQLGLPSNSKLYQTLSDRSQVNPRSNMSRIRLLFNDAMTTAELTKLLQQTDAQIRQGPSELGLFIIEMPQQRVKQSLEIFSSNQHIRLVEQLEVTP